MRAMPVWSPALSTRSCGSGIILQTVSGASLNQVPDQSARGIVRVSGPDAAALLNGQLTQDLRETGPDKAVFAAMLSPQGKYLFDMFVIQPEADVFVLDVSRAPDFVRRLAMFRLRAAVEIVDVSDSWCVAVAGGSPRTLPHPALPHQVWATFADPRLDALPARAIIPRDADRDVRSDPQLRHALGVPDLQYDLLIDKDFALEGLLEELHGVDFHKGCYVGQEMTSRMKRRTSVRNKLCRVRYDGPAPDFETPILAEDWEVGRMRTGSDHVGLAMIRFDRVAKARHDGVALLCGSRPIRLDPPDWLIQPAF